MLEVEEGSMRLRCIGLPGGAERLLSPEQACSNSVTAFSLLVGVADTDIP
jgi:hypothetical protein